MATEYVATFAAEVDEGSVSALQSLLSENAELAEALAGALESVASQLGAVEGAVSSAAGQLGALSGGFEETASGASAAASAVEELVGAYNALSSAAPTGALEIDLTGGSDSYENGQKTNAVTDILSTISTQIGRFFTPTGGDSSSGGSSGGSEGGEGGFGLEVALNLDGAEEALQGFLEGLGEEAAEVVLELNVEDAESMLEDFLGNVEAEPAETTMELDTSPAETALETLLGEVESSAPVISAEMDMSAADQALQAFLEKAAKPVALSADASGITSAASAALAEVEAMYAGASVTINANVVTNNNGNGGDSEGSGESSGSGESGSDTTRTGSAGSPLNALMQSTGGRFTEPTNVEVAEEGSPEYIIPMARESIAVPLIRQMLSELSASARQSLSGDLGSLGSGLEAMTSMLSGADLGGGMSAGAVNVQNTVDAPVNITVNASGTDPVAVGQSVYDVTERYLLRSLQSVF